MYFRSFDFTGFPHMPIATWSRCQFGFAKACQSMLRAKNYKKSSRVNIGDDEASPRQIFFAERNDDLCDGRTHISTKSAPTRQHAVSESHCNIERSTGKEIGYGLPN